MFYDQPVLHKLVVCFPLVLLSSCFVVLKFIQIVNRGFIAGSTCNWVTSENHVTFISPRPMIADVYKRQQFTLIPHCNRCKIVRKWLFPPLCLYKEYRVVNDIIDGNICLLKCFIIFHDILEDDPEKCCIYKLVFAHIAVWWVANKTFEVGYSVLRIAWTVITKQL